MGVTFSQQDLTPFEVEDFVQDLQESDDTPSVDGNQKSAVKTSWGWMRLVGNILLFTRVLSCVIYFRLLFGVSEASTVVWNHTLQGTVTYPTEREQENHRLKVGKGRDIVSSQEGKILTLKDYHEKSIFSLFFVCSAGLPANADGESLCINECFCMFVSALNPPFFARIFRRFVWGVQIRTSWWSVPPLDLHWCIKVIDVLFDQAGTRT